MGRTLAVAPLIPAAPGTTITFTLMRFQKCDLVQVMTVGAAISVAAIPV